MVSVRICDRGPLQGAGFRKGPGLTRFRMVEDGWKPLRFVFPRLTHPGAARSKPALGKAGR